MPQVNVRLDHALLVRLDALVAGGHYRDRATAMRAAMQMLLVTEDHRARGRRIVALDEATIERLNLVLEIT